MKRINELTTEELRKIFDNNEKLRYDISEDAHDNEMFWIGEHLENLTSALNDWSIGPCERPYIRINNNRLRDFIEGVLQNQRDYGVMPDDWTKKAEGVALTIDAYYEEDCYSDRYDELGEQAEREAQELADDIASQYEDMLQFYYDDENLFDYFINSYVELRMNDEDFYVSDEYELFEKRVVSYA